jgi:hypothetical protein
LRRVTRKHQKRVIVMGRRIIATHLPIDLNRRVCQGPGSTKVVEIIVKSGHRM